MSHVWQQIFQSTPATAHQLDSNGEAFAGLHAETSQPWLAHQGIGQRRQLHQLLHLWAATFSMSMEVSPACLEAWEGGPGAGMGQCCHGYDMQQDHRKSA